MSSPKGCSPRPSPARPPLRTASPPRHGPVPAARGPWPATRARPASCIPAPATPPGRSRKATAPAVGGLFFPQSQTLGLDRTDYSPGLQDQLLYTGITNSSFEAARADAAKLLRLDISAKQIERLCKRIGLERTEERDEAAAAYQALPLPQRKGLPQGVSPPAVAVVGTDGGRLQIRERTAAEAAAPAPEGTTAPAPAQEGAPRGERGRFWREDKVGLLMAMASDVSAAD